MGTPLTPKKKAPVDHGQGEASSTARESDEHRPSRGDEAAAAWVAMNQDDE